MRRIRRGPTIARASPTPYAQDPHDASTAASTVGVAGVAGVAGAPGHAGHVGHVGHPGQAGTDAGENQRDTMPVTQQTTRLLAIELADGIQRGLTCRLLGPAGSIMRLVKFADSDLLLRSFTRRLTCQV